MWAVASFAWAVVASIHDAKSLCGLSCPLCGLLQHLCVMCRCYVGCFITCVGCSSLYVGCCIIYTCCVRVVFDIKSSIRAGTDSVHDVQALCGMTHPPFGMLHHLCRLLQPLQLLQMRYIGCCILYIGSIDAMVLNAGPETLTLLE